MELTEAIRDYVVEKETNLGRLLKKLEDGTTEAFINFEVSRATNHHKAGFIFHADCLIKFNGEEFYGSADQEDLFAAVDEVKEKLFLEIDKNKTRKQTLFIRGARSVKKMLKGLSKRNPFTGKY